MRKADYPEEIQRLVAQLRRLPGIGPRSAERLAVALITGRNGLALELARSLEAAVRGVTLCGRCGFFQSVTTPCVLCNAADREPHVLCVVEQPTDVLPLERTGAFAGRYHVLGGRLAPLDNVHPEDLRIDSLISRIDEGGITEVILATGSDVEGEATAHYIAERLGGRPELKVTRLAQGLPAGGGLEHADDLTLMRALSGRRRI
jgi:recombination protein RecR